MNVVSLAYTKGEYFMEIDWEELLGTDDYDNGFEMIQDSWDDAVDAAIEEDEKYNSSYEIQQDKTLIVFNNTEYYVPNKICGHTLTDQEAKKLGDGESIDLLLTSKKGNEFAAKGKFNPHHSFNNKKGEKITLPGIDLEFSKNENQRKILSHNTLSVGKDNKWEKFVDVIQHNYPGSPLLELHYKNESTKTHIKIFLTKEELNELNKIVENFDQLKEH